MLHAAQHHPTVFLSVEWVDSWLAVFGESLRPMLWAVTVSDTVVGAALLVSATERRGGIPVRCLYLNTAGEGEDSVTVEHNTVLAAPGSEEAVWQALATTLRGLTWDEFRLCGGDPNAVEQLRSLFTGCQSTLEARAAPFIPLASLQGNTGGLLAKLSTNTRSQLRRAARSAAQRGALTLEEATTPALRADFWRELGSLHTARWRERGQSGAFARPRWRAFHERLLAAEPRCARLFRLRVAGETVAAVYVLQYQRHVAFYQSGIVTRAGDNREKPGLVIQQLVVDQLAAEGYSEYDFLASDGPELRYKRSLATDERLLWWGAIVRPTVRSRVIQWLRVLRGRFRSRGV
jgi:CelD/BcsL family acetyltransferase involved in cellulose biosynthesis